MSHPEKNDTYRPEHDLSLALSGHPAKMPPPDVTAKRWREKGWQLQMILLPGWPWGISYAANITSDSTGIGAWTEEQFILCLREGKWKGLAGNRTLLPPMPWNTSFKYMTDSELKAIFAYLKSTTPIRNVEPPIEPPVSAGKPS
ncbi:MAG: hypothetical protein WKI04_07605 [Ferruginibacter sp.]